MNVIPMPIPQAERELTGVEALLYNFTAAARLLQVEESEIAALTPVPEGCLVEFNDKPWKALIPVREFLNQFVSDRRARAKALIPTQHVRNGAKWTVYNETSGSRHDVTLSTDAVRCTCPDWHEQYAAFGHSQVCCKHCYCVLAELGYGSLKDYLKAWQPGGKLVKMQTKMARKR